MPVGDILQVDATGHQTLATDRTVTATEFDTADASTTALSADGSALTSTVARSQGEGDADATSDAQTESGIASARQQALTADGSASAYTTAIASGTGAADTSSTSTTVTGNATSGISAIRDAVEASVLVDSTAANARVLAVASDISLTATDDLTLTGTGSVDVDSNGGITLSAVGTASVNGALVEIGSGNVIINIPTTDPGGGALWCDPADGFTVKVSQT